MVPGNAIAQEALQHFEVAYRYMAGTLAPEPTVSLNLLSKSRFSSIQTRRNSRLSKS